MGSLDDKVRLAGDFDIVLEVVRQWLVLLACISLCTLYILATVRLYRTFRSLNFEVVLMSFTVVRIFFMFMYEFLVPHIAVLFVMMNMHTLAISLVFLKFASHILSILKKQDLMRRYLLPLYAFLTLIVIIDFVLAFVLTHGLDCNHDTFGIHWFLVTSIDLLTGIANVVVGYYLTRYISEERESTPGSHSLYSREDFTFNMN